MNMEEGGVASVALFPFPLVPVAIAVFLCLSYPSIFLANNSYLNRFYSHIYAQSVIDSLQSAS